MLLIVRGRSFWTPGALSETGEEGPWLQGGREHVGQEKAPSPGLSLCPCGNHPSLCCSWGPASPPPSPHLLLGKMVETPGGRML